MKLKNISIHPTIILLVILALGLALRLYHLATHPPGLTWDEAALGYNAYSIFKTARDEHGTLLPLVFKSFGDYKPGLYVYLTIPFVALFGLTPFTTRLLSALFGALAIWAVYLLAQQIFSEEKSKTIPLATTLTLAIMPWHLHFSHAAWEANIFVTLLTFALYFFVRFLKTNFPLWPSIILATATFFVYQGAKLLTPLVFLTTLIVYHRNLNKLFTGLKEDKLSRYLTIICALITTGLFLTNLLGPAGNRLQRLSIFGYQPPVSQHVKQVDQNNPLTLSLFHHQLDLTPRLIFARFIHHFSPDLLFYSKGLTLKREHLPDQGLLHILDFFLLASGLIYLLKSKRKIATNLILTLLLISPIPASLTLSEASTVRALFMVIPLSLIIGAGIKNLFSQKWLFIPFSMAYLLTVVLSLDIYFNHSSKVLAQEFNFGHRQAVQVIQDHPSSKVVFTDVYGQPYIYYLFYSQFPPRKYQQQNNFINQGVDVGRVGDLGRISFHHFSTSQIQHSKNTIFIGSTGNIPDSFDPNQDFVDFYRSITLPNSTDEVFRIVKTK